MTRYDPRAGRPAIAVVRPFVREFTKPARFSV